MKTGEKRKKITYRAGIMILIAVILTIGGTLAYLSNSDKVTNMQAGKDISIVLLEPEWQKSGQKDAMKLEPGMSIAKDPYVLNNSGDSVYVRMQIVIKDKDGKNIKVTEDRYQSILKSLYLSAQNPDVLSEKAEIPLVKKITVDSASGGLSDITLNRTAFYYEDGWFYYGSDSENRKSYTALGAGESTPSLFDKLCVPIYRESAREALKDNSLLIYDDVFDTPFTIEVIAQAISARIEDSKVISTFNKLK